MQNIHKHICIKTKIGDVSVKVLKMRKNNLQFNCVNKTYENNLPVCIKKSMLAYMIVEIIVGLDNNKNIRDAIWIANTHVEMAYDK